MTSCFFFGALTMVLGSRGNKLDRHPALCFVTRAHYAVTVAQLLSSVRLVSPHKF